MAVKDSQTEELIKQTAKKIFFAEGHFRATTQEIADAAGVNRTLVNYYFRSRDHLFELVLKDAREAMERRIGDSFSRDLPFREKIRSMIDILLEQSYDYPFMEIYAVTRSREQGSYDFTPGSAKDEKFQQFLKEVEKEIKKGNVKAPSATHFLLSIFSLMSHPITFRSLYQNMFRLNDTQYKKILKQRTDIILDMLFK